MATRLEQLNKYLETLVALGPEVYQEEINIALGEIRTELGVGKETALSSYSTKELHEELVKREGIKEVIIHIENEAVIKRYVGDQDEIHSIRGPARILVNQD